MNHKRLMLLIIILSFAFLLAACGGDDTQQPADSGGEQTVAEATNTPMPEPTDTPVPPAPTDTPTPIPTFDTPTPPGPGDGRLEVDPGFGPAGTGFTFKLTEFDPLEAVTVHVETPGGELIDSLSVNVGANGALDVPWQSPETLAAGPYVVRPFGDDGRPGEPGTLVITD